MKRDGQDENVTAHDVTAKAATEIFIQMGLNGSILVLVVGCVA